jgi:hypothetical protein
MDKSEEDAAFIDSFFLPGGILDPDDEDNKGIHAFPNVRRIPCNPWKNEYFPDISSNLGAPQLDTFFATPFLGTPERGDNDIRSNSGACPNIMRPTPGYTENDRFEHTSTGLHFVNNDSDIAILSGPSHLLCTGQTDVARKTKSNHASTLQDHTINLGIKPEVSPTSEKHSKTDILSVEMKPICHSSENVNSVMDINELDKNSKDEGCTPERMEGSSRSETSIPIDILHMHAMTQNSESMVTSLSTSTSCDEAVGTRGSMMKIHAKEGGNNDGCRDEDSARGGIPIQASNLIKQAKSRKLANHFVNEASEGDMTPKNQCSGNILSKGKTKERPSQVDALRPALCQFWILLLQVLISTIEVPRKIFKQCTITAIQFFRQSSRFLFITDLHKFFLSKCKEFTNWFRSYYFWLMEYIDIFGALADRLRLTISASFLFCVKILTLLMSFLLQIWKFALIESLEESNVTACYVVFYFMPNFCSLFMSIIDLPHWTPHLATSMSVFVMCNEVKPGKIYEEKMSLSKLIAILERRDTNEFHQFATSTGERKGNESYRNERACNTILKILRYVLPVFFIVGGFSSEFGTIIGFSSASRLTTAFMMSLVRKKIVSSPIGWTSWAIQVLVATYYSRWILLDQVVLVVGLSSIRLIRFLENRRVQRKRN